VSEETPAPDEASRPGETPAPDAIPPRRPRRQRGAAESLGQVVLGAEALIMFLAGLVIYGLKALPFGIAPWWGIVVGIVLAVLMLVASGLTRHRWGIVVGWALQVVVALCAFLVPAMLIVALIFGGMYGYATIKGASLDRRNARIMRESANGD
jgi:hypothetical protein